MILLYASKQSSCETTERSRARDSEKPFSCVRVENNLEVDITRQVGVGEKKF
jgi:hypothetical protein